MCLIFMVRLLHENILTKNISQIAVDLSYYVQCKCDVNYARKLIISTFVNIYYLHQTSSKENPGNAKQNSHTDRHLCEEYVAAV